MTLWHALVESEHAKPERLFVFLHGILGSGANFRTLAREFVRRKPRWGVVLVDLRMHGQSQGFAPPHTVASAAADVAALELPLPVRGVIGHSFGGKVAMELLRTRELDIAWIIDSTPSAENLGTKWRDSSLSGGVGGRSPLTVTILELIRRLPTRFESREQFIDEVMKNGHTREIAMWLAMNLRIAGDHFEQRVDVSAIRALLMDYFERDEWDALEATRTNLHFVFGGKSDAVSPADRARAEEIARVHVIPKAGHWVHADAPTELIDLVEQCTPD